MQEVEEKRNYKFPKEARLHHRSLVEGLFRLGKSFYEFPFRVSWRIMTEEELQKNFRNEIPENIGKIQMMVTVPKKKRRHATDRVLMRRRIKEAYRLNCHTLQEMTKEREDLATMSVALIYVHDQNLPYSAIEYKMKILLDKLEKKLTG